MDAIVFSNSFLISMFNLVIFSTRVMTIPSCIINNKNVIVKRTLLGDSGGGLINRFYVPYCQINYFVTKIMCYKIECHVGRFIVVFTYELADNVGPTNHTNSGYENS